MRSYLLITAAVLLATGHADFASAQTFEFYPYGAENAEDLNEEEFGDFLNLSRCLCDEAAADTGGTNFWVRVRDSSGNYGTDDVYFYLGDDCDNDAVVISEQCFRLAVINHSRFNQEQALPIPVNRIVDPIDGMCSEENGGSSKLYVIMGDPNNQATATYTLSYDTKPPGPPIAISGSSGEESVTISWDPSDTEDVNIEFYNILCALDGTPVPGVSSEGMEDWVSTESVCDASLEVGDATDAGAGALCGPLEAGGRAYPCYTCGSVPRTSTEARISGLENGVTYSFGVVAVDYQGNVSAVSEVITFAPIPTTDFAEHYRDSGGAEDGGFCFVATAVYGDYDHPRVKTLRAFRDQVLSRSKEGRRFVAWYYRNGRKLAAMTWSSPELGLLAWLALERARGQVALLLGEPGAPAGPLPWLLAMGLLLGGALRRRGPRRGEQAYGAPLLDPPDRATPRREGAIELAGPEAPARDPEVQP